MAIASEHEVLERPAATVRTFSGDATGATMVEYGLIVAMISAVVMVALNTTGHNIAGVFGNLSATLAQRPS